MGNSICYFVDTDLSDMSPRMLHQTIRKRCGSPIVFKDINKASYWRDQDDSSQWSYVYEGNFASAVKYTNLELHRDSDEVSFEMGYWNKTFDITEFWVDGEELFLSNDRFFNFKAFLSEYTEDTLHQLKRYIDGVKKYIAPIVNCHRLFLCGDQVGDSDNEDWMGHMLAGMSIDEALEWNSKRSNPEIAFTWDNLEVMMDHYVDEGTFFVFDLDNLPPYLK